MALTSPATLFLSLSQQRDPSLIPSPANPIVSAPRPVPASGTGKGQKQTFKHSDSQLSPDSSNCKHAVSERCRILAVSWPYPGRILAVFWPAHAHPRQTYPCTHNSYVPA
eukprot:264131-Rhodomonas_salina.2